MAPTNEKRFWLLRRLSKLMSVLAWIVLVIVALVVPVGIARSMLSQSLDLAIQTLTYGASGLFIFIYLLYTAQWIQVILAMEENTRQSTYVLEKLTTMTQQIRDRLGEAAEQAAERAGEESLRRDEMS